MARTLVGLIADTHGLLRPEAVAALAGAAHIVHAGDIGSRTDEPRGVLDALARIAPLTVVRGTTTAPGGRHRFPTRRILNSRPCASTFYTSWASSPSIPQRRA
jgi:predicted phosphodiesterase